MSAKRTKRILAALAVVCAGGFVVWRLTAGATAARPPEASGPPAVPITADVAKTQDVPVLVDALGTAQSIDNVAVQSRVTGPIVKVSFTPGQEVTQGQPLFLIDPRPYQAALDQAQGQLQRDQAALAGARRDLARYQALAATKNAPQQQVENQSATVQQGEGTLKVDQAAIDTARLNLSFCQITAPITGRTGVLQIDLGNMVQANSPNPLVTITQTKPIYVRFSVPADRLDEIRRNQAAGPLEVEAGSLDGQPLAKGQLTLINNQVDASTGTIMLQGTFANDDGSLWPGEFVNTQLVIAIRHDAVTVPSQAVMAGPNGSYVYVLQPGDTVRQVGVQVAARQNGLAVIEKGLSAGDRVVTDGQYRLANNAKVKIQSGRSAG